MWQHLRLPISRENSAMLGPQQSVILAHCQSIDRFHAERVKGAEGSIEVFCVVFRENRRKMCRGKYVRGRASDYYRKLFLRPRHVSY